MDVQLNGFTLEDWDYAKWYDFMGVITNPCENPMQLTSCIESDRCENDQ
jgi:hypothetical protein